MTDDLVRQTTECIEDTRALYHGLVILVGLRGFGKTRSLPDIQAETSALLVNVNIEPREHGEKFLKHGQLTDLLEQDFAEAVREVISGLTKLEISMGDLRDALLAGGNEETI